jgi:sugar/nucleoside kinase (ribokinase family)
MDLIAFGTVFLEIVFGRTASAPVPGDEIYADEFAFSCGGGAITAAAAAAAGGVRAGVATLLGDDLGSRLAVAYCRRAGVDLAPSRQVRGAAAGVTVALNFGGDRAFVSYLPPRPAAAAPAAERWLDAVREHRPAWCYLHAGPGRAGLLAEARSLGARIAVDVALHDIARDREAVLSCVRQADVFLPNADELLRLTGAGTLDAALRLALGWCRCVVVKRGAAGATVADRDGAADITEGVSPVLVRDRTGAGDAFAGGLIGALCRGATLAEAAQAGNAAGSAAVSRLGAVGELDVDGPDAAGLLVAAAAGGRAGHGPGPGAGTA